MQLRDLERSIIVREQKELVDVLKADSVALKNLSAEIKEDADKLADIAATIEKTADITGSLVKVITAALGAGFI